MNVLLVPAHPGFPGQIPQSRKMVVVVLLLSLEIFLLAETANCSIETNNWLKKTY